MNYFCSIVRVSSQSTQEHYKVVFLTLFSNKGFFFSYFTNNSIHCNFNKGRCTVHGAEPPNTTVAYTKTSEVRLVTLSLAFLISTCHMSSLTERKQLKEKKKQYLCCVERCSVDLFSLPTHSEMRDFLTVLAVCLSWSMVA